MWIDLASEADHTQYTMVGLIFALKKLNSNCNLIFFIQRAHYKFHWLLSDEFMPYVNPEEKIQVDLSSAIPAAYVWLWERQLIFKVVCSGFLDLATLVLYY